MSVPNKAESPGEKVEKVNTTTSSSEDESWSDNPQKKNKKKKKRKDPTRKPASKTSSSAAPSKDATPVESPTTQSLTNAIALPPTMRLLVCSIGNPAPYLNTLHSAGHTVLSAVGASLAYPPFAKSRSHGNGLLSEGAEFSLWQSTSMMNVSGSGVAAAFRQFVKENGGQGRLVVVHDELELALGGVKVKGGELSTKGHNGLKSIQGSFRGEWTRIGVGIGRPESREREDVSRFVLKKMSPQERMKVEGSVGRVLEELRRLGS